MFISVWLLRRKAATVQWLGQWSGDRGTIPAEACSNDRNIATTFNQNCPNAAHKSHPARRHVWAV